MSQPTLGICLRRVCVFCGSNPGAHPDFAHVTRELGRVLVEQRIELVYGGGRVGLMGEIANAVLAAGGKVTGIIPEHLEVRELAHRRLTELRVVETMHQRKALMADLSDGFIALPGGLGTFEEFFEVATWTQLGIHQKPLGLLNVRGYFDPLVDLLARAVEDRFLRDEHRALIAVRETPRALLEALRAFRPVHLEKWLDRSER